RRLSGSDLARQLQSVAHTARELAPRSPHSLRRSAESDDQHPLRTRRRHIQQPPLLGSLELLLDLFVPIPSRRHRDVFRALPPLAPDNEMSPRFLAAAIDIQIDREVVLVRGIDQKNNRRL